LVIIRRIQVDRWVVRPVACHRPTIAGLVPSDRSVRAASGSPFESQLDLCRREPFAPCRELGHAMLETQKPHRCAQALARRPGQEQELLAHFTGKMRGRSLAQQRRDAHRVALHDRVFDLVEIPAERGQGVARLPVPKGA